MKKTEITLDFARNVTEDWSLTQEDLAKHVEEFERNFDPGIFLRRWETRSELYNMKWMTYHQMMSGCYDVCEKPLDKLDWYLAQNHFCDMIERRDFFQRETFRPTTRAK